MTLEAQPLSQDATVAIIGASHAGVQLAAELRSGGFAGRMLLFGDEPATPYQRPPLSKGLLQGKTREDQLALRGSAFWDEQRIELCTGCRVSSIDVATRQLSLADGRRLGWDQLVLATGARGRTLSADPLPAGVHLLRTLADAQALDRAAQGAERAVIVGGGYIGLEAAAALRQRGLEVLVMEAQPRLLARSLPETLAAALQREHEAQGVRFVFGAAFAGWGLDAQGRLAEVQLADGRRWPATLAVLGIGVQPNVELAQAAGLDCADGVVVDAAGRSSAPHVWAIGDVAAAPQPFAANPIRPQRLESIQAALDGARATAAALLGRPLPPAPVPWFWTEQWGWRLQMVGLPDAGDTWVLRGALDAGRASLFALRGGRIAAVHSVNRPAEHMLARKLVAARCAATAEALADEAFDLKALLPAA